MLAGARASVRERAARELWQRIDTGQTTVKDIDTLMRMGEKAGMDKVVDFMETGKIPEGFDLSHAYSASANPETAGRPDLAQFLPHDEHIEGFHGGDTRVPLYGMPRNPDYDGTSGFQIIDANTPQGRAYLGIPEPPPSQASPVQTKSFTILKF